jgi:predicted secreted protein
MKFHKIILIFLLGVGCGCEKYSINRQITPEDHNDKQLIIVNQNDTVDLNQSFNIQLEGNLSTGYFWFWINKSSTAHFDSVNIKYTQIAERTGSGEIQTWTFKAGHVGLDSIQFEYKRWWEINTPPLRYAKYIILVK